MEKSSTPAPNLSRRLLLALLHPRAAVIAHDLTMVGLAWTLAKSVRLSFLDTTQIKSFVPEELAIVLAIQALAFWWTGLYRGLWRFASVPDLWNIGRAVVAGALAIAVALFLYNRLEEVPRSVAILYPLILFVLLGVPRLLYRGWKDRRSALIGHGEVKRVLVIGAGQAGELLVRDLRQLGRYRPVAFLDDDPKLKGARLHDIPVLGGTADLVRVANEVAAEMILIAIPTLDRAEMRQLVQRCEQTGLPFRTVPRLEDIVAGRSHFNELKEVSIDDLLGRAPVQLDWTAIRRELAGRRILVTGGGGSIGGELCRQIARLGPARLGILDQSEYNLYQIERALRSEHPDLQLDCILGNVCDGATMTHVMGAVQPELVFHAAAYKHVPMLEAQVREAVRNNVLGTAQVAEAALAAGVSRFVLISTDKAVNPANVMGASKRVAEQYVQALARESALRIVTVRFGNVLDSAGSVVPLFREQIRRGGPVTVTHPEICRYFMTIPEACQLIFQAAVLGQGGEIYALDMGEPVLIRDLAEQMIRLAGKEPDRDIAIVYTGLREGEKLYEELFHAHENYAPTRHPKIFEAQSNPPSLAEIRERLRQAAAHVKTYDSDALLDTLGALVPAFDAASRKTRATEPAVPESLP